MPHQQYDPDFEKGERYGIDTLVWQWNALSRRIEKLDIQLGSTLLFPCAPSCANGTIRRRMFSIGFGFPSTLTR